MTPGEGWIPLWRKALQNDVRRFDHTAWYVFETLLLICDQKTGEWRGGRFQLAHLCNMNPNTTYSAIKRLEKAKMATLSSNNKYTTIHICNLSKYEVGGNTNGQQRGNNAATTRQHSNKNKELRIKKDTMSVSDETARTVYEFYLKAFGQSESRYKLTDARKRKLTARVRENGSDALKRAIEAVSNSPWHRGDNDRGWKADLDFIIRSYEQVEKFANQESELKPINVEEALKNL